MTGSARLGVVSMPPSAPAPVGPWITFALGTVLCWGVYGIFLHTGQMAMQDPQFGRYKAFLWVGVAYFLIAVLAPALLLWFGGADWSMPWKGSGWSLVAGIVGAFGAFFVLLAFGAKGHPAAVMSIVFAGAPIVNAVVGILLHPPGGGFRALRWQFVVGILLAALGGTLVSYYKPAPGPAKAPAAAPETR